MSEAKDLLSISDFYAQKTVFITGATGFLGKVVIEKLLRACPHVKKIYLLARSRRGVSPQQRIDDLLDGMVGFSYDSSFFFTIFLMPLTLKLILIWDSVQIYHQKLNADKLLWKNCSLFSPLETLLLTTQLYCNCDLQYLSFSDAATAFPNYGCFFISFYG